MRTPLILAAFGLLLLTGGCNTVSGIGKDVAATGRGISNASQFVQEDLLGLRPPPPPATTAMPPAPGGRASVTIRPACDPEGDELAGGNGLPRCDTPRMRAEVRR